MIVKCPNCMHSRSVLEEKIPPTAEYAKCPKCGHRFKFRTVEAPKEQPVQVQAEQPRQPQSLSAPEPQNTHSHINQTPTEPIRQNAEAHTAPLKNLPGAVETVSINQNHYISDPTPAKQTEAKTPVKQNRLALEISEPKTVAPVDVNTPPKGSAPAQQNKSAEKPKKSMDIWDAVESLHQRWTKRSKASQPKEPLEISTAQEPDEFEQKLLKGSAVPQQHQEPWENSAEPHHTEDVANQSYWEQPNHQDADETHTTHAKHPSADEAKPQGWQALEAEEELENDDYALENTRENRWEEESEQTPNGLVEDFPEQDEGIASYYDEEETELEAAALAKVQPKGGRSWQRPVITPEQKVEQDMRLLVATNKRKVRDLGVLVDTGDDPEHGDIAQDDEILDLKKNKRTWLTDIWLNFSGTVLFNQSALRSRHPHTGMTTAFLIASLQGILLLWGVNLWAPRLHAILDFLPSREAISPLTMNILAPAILLLGIFMITGLFRVFSMVIDGRPPLGSGLVKILCYATIPLSLALVHPYGLFAGVGWSAMAAGTACKRAFHKNRLAGLVMTVLVFATFFALALALLTLGHPAALPEE